MTDMWAGIRESIRDRWERIAAKADPDCHMCKGRGKTYGYIGPGKTAEYPCPCTGERP